MAVNNNSADAVQTSQLYMSTHVPTWQRGHANKNLTEVLLLETWQQLCVPIRKADLK